MKPTTWAVQIGKTLFVLTLSLLILTLHTIHAQDVIAFPSLTGSYHVGQVELYLADPARPETFTDEPDDVRELMTIIFYPADTSGDAKPAPYGNDALKAEASTWPGIDSNRWSQIQTGLLADVPFAAGEETYPVILLSPGFGTPPLYYTTLLAEIASHGYVAISISRTYSTALTVFPDGRLIRQNTAGADIDPVSGDTYFDALEKRARVNDVWVADIRFVLDQLEVLNREDSLLGGHLDLKMVGLIGHSFGGSASAETAYLDRRIGAVISMDSNLDGDVAHAGLSQPYLYMEPANPPYEDPDQMPADEQITAMGLTRDQLFSEVLIRINHMNLLESSSAGYRLRLDGAVHLTFTTDLHVFAQHFPNRVTERQVGTLEGERALAIISSYSLAFFDQHLKGQESPLLSSETSDAEVIFETF